MPSPRAVLADIHDFKLDPMKAYKTTNASGHLAKKDTVTVEDVPVRNALVELQNADAADDAESLTKKKAKFVKKDKKEKTEE
jgi:hypothetical protein